MLGIYQLDPEVSTRHQQPKDRSINAPQQGNIQTNGRQSLTLFQGGCRPMYPPHLKQKHNHPMHQPVRDDQGKLNQILGMNPISSIHQNNHGGCHDPPPSSSQHQHPYYIGHSSVQTNNSMHEGHMQRTSSKNNSRRIQIVAMILFLLVITFLALFLYYFFEAKDKNKTKFTGDPDEVTRAPLYGISTTTVPSKTKYTTEQVEVTTEQVLSGMNTTATTPSHNNMTTQYITGEEKVAADILSGMDTTVDPCKDFYRYACGGEIKKTVIPQGKTSYGMFQKLNDKNRLLLNQIMKNIKADKHSSPLLKKASTMYEACMDVSKVKQIGDAPVKEVIKKLGSWPVDPQFNRSSWNFTKVIADYYKTFYTTFLNVGISVTTDLKNTSKYAINFATVNKFSLLHLDRNVVDEGVTSTAGVNTNTFTYNMAKRMGANYLSLIYLNQALAFKRKLSWIFERTKLDNYEKMTLKEFAKKTEIPLIQLTSVLQLMFDDTGYQITANEPIVSYSTEYIKNAYRLFSRLTPEVQASYLISEVISIAKPFIDFQSEQYGGGSNPIPRWEWCLTMTSQVYNLAIAKPFVEKVLDKTSKIEIINMTREIKQIFKKNLNSMYWLDSSTRNTAILKISKMQEQIGYPEEIFNNTAMEKMLGDFNPKPDSYILNMIEAQSFLRKTSYKQLGKPVDKKLWRRTIYLANAFHEFVYNRISFPAGILQPKFYNKKAPKAAKYGSLGWIIGHEITHGFDPRGIKFTPEGNYRSWFSNGSLQQFNRKAQCFVNQYSDYKLFNYRLYGRQTLGENIADNGGVRQAFQAYKNWVTTNGEEEKLPGLNLTLDQIFFVSFGQSLCSAYTRDYARFKMGYSVHSPKEFRVKGVLQNFGEFSRAFNCPVGSPMNPPSKCQMW